MTVRHRRGQVLTTLTTAAVAGMQTTVPPTPATTVAVLRVAAMPATSLVSLRMTAADRGIAGRMTVRHRRGPVLTASTTTAAVAGMQTTVPPTPATTVAVLRVAAMPATSLVSLRMTAADRGIAGRMTVRHRRGPVLTASTTTAAVAGMQTTVPPTPATTVAVLRVAAMPATSLVSLRMTAADRGIAGRMTVRHRRGPVLTASTTTAAVAGMQTTVPPTPATTVAVLRVAAMPATSLVSLRMTAADRGIAGRMTVRHRRGPVLTASTTTAAVAGMQTTVPPTPATTVAVLRVAAMPATSLVSLRMTAADRGIAGRMTVRHRRGPVLTASTTTAAVAGMQTTVPPTPATTVAVLRVAAMPGTSLGSLRMTAADRGIARRMTVRHGRGQVLTASTTTAAVAGMQTTVPPTPATTVAVLQVAAMPATSLVSLRMTAADRGIARRMTVRHRRGQVLTASTTTAAVAGMQTAVPPTPARTVAVLRVAAIPATSLVSLRMTAAD